MSKTIPNIVSYRNHFSPADELVDKGLPFLPNQFKHENFRAWLTRYTETVIKSIASDLAVGAQRGIEQTANMLCDPGFYELRKKRRMQERKRWKEERAKQEWERIERQHCPTAEQIKQQVAYSEREIKYCEAQIAKHTENLARLRNIAPKNIRFTPKSVQ